MGIIFKLDPLYEVPNTIHFMNLTLHIYGRYMS